MSRHLYLLSRTSSEIICVGKVWSKSAGGPPAGVDIARSDEARALVVRAIVKFLATHAGERVEVVYGYDLQDDLGDLIEIGGDTARDVPLLEYVEGFDFE
ncbi:MAG: hypothetical protein R3B72_07450 [Polyangiaceae bacterium]